MGKRTFRISPDAFRTALTKFAVFKKPSAPDSSRCTAPVRSYEDAKVAYGYFISLVAYLNAAEELRKYRSNQTAVEKIKADIKSAKVTDNEALKALKDKFGMLSYARSVNEYFAFFDKAVEKAEKDEEYYWMQLEDAAKCFGDSCWLNGDARAQRGLLISATDAISRIQYYRNEILKNGASPIALAELEAKYLVYARG